MTKKAPTNNKFVSEENFFLNETNVLTDDWMTTAPIQKEMLEEEMEGQLSVDVIESDKEIIIKAPIAGVDADELDVAITDHTVTIRGERIEEHEVDNHSFHMQECYWGTFSRVVTLPAKVLADEANAEFNKGILIIRIPKAEINKVRKLKIAKK